LVATMEESSQGLNEPLIGGNSNDDSTLATSSTTLLDDCNDADAAAGGGINQSSTSKQNNHTNQKKISGFVLAIIVFFNACGGPFGIEPALKAAGNLYAIIGISVMPFIWSLPESIITYEMSSKYPCASGGKFFDSVDDHCNLLFVNSQTYNTSYTHIYRYRCAMG